MATYYVRTDGLQTDKALATVGGSAANALSVAGHNAETYASGDEVIFENDATYTDSIEFNTAGVTYGGATVATAPTVNPTGEGLILKAANIVVRNFNGTGGTGAWCVFDGLAAGEGNLSGWEVRDVTCTAATAGDAFSIKSNGAGDAANGTFTRCHAESVSGAGNQAFTCHNDQYMTLNDCSTGATVTLAVANASVGSIPSRINGGTFNATTDVDASAGSAGTIWTNVTVNSDAGGTGGVFDHNGGWSKWVNCTGTFKGAGVNYLRGASDYVTFEGGTWTFAGTGATQIEHISSAVGAVTFDDVNLVFTAIGSRWARSGTQGGVFKLHRCKIDLTAHSGSADRWIQGRATSGSPTHEFHSNVVLGSADISAYFEFLTGTKDNLDAINNTLYEAGTGTRFTNHAGDGTVTFTNNIIHDYVSNTLQGVGTHATSYNCWSGTTPDQSGTGGITTDAVFVNAPTNLYADATSPVIAAGTSTAVTLDKDKNAFYSPPSMGAYEFLVGGLPSLGGNNDLRRMRNRRYRYLRSQE